MEITGIPSGFDELDKISSGFHPGELIIIAARPGLGKTAFGLSIAANISIRQSKPVAFFSLEMPEQLLKTRLISTESGIDTFKLRKDLFSSSDKDSKILPATERIHNAPLHIVDMPYMTILDIQTVARRLRIEEKVEIIFIDYIGLIAQDNKLLSRLEYFSEISKSLKELAQELNIPVVGLSQLRREAENQTSSLDIKDTSFIEEYADIKMLLIRGREMDESIEGHVNESGQRVQLVLTKNRKELLGTVDLIFYKHLSKFVSNRDY